MSCCDARFLGQACGCDAEREQDEREWQRRKKEIAAREGWIRADERRLIVADLRMLGERAELMGGAVGKGAQAALLDAADRYERGDHHR
jgi:hypothetical protein